MRVVVITVTVVVLLGKFVHGQPTASYHDLVAGETGDIFRLQLELEILRMMMEEHEKRLADIHTLLQSVYTLAEQSAKCIVNQPIVRRNYISPEDTNSHPLPDKSSPQSSSSLVTRLDISDRWAYGITKLKDNIYVLCYNPSSIVVAEDRAPYDLRIIDATQLQNPYNIAANRQLNSLFIIDIGNHCIWKMTADDEEISLWLAGITDGHELSVTSDGLVLIITDTSINIYGPDAEIVDHIPLDDIFEPLHAVQTQSGSFIVSHKRSDVDDTWIISELNSEGLVLRNSTGREESSLSEPIHLFLDSQDRLFVADRWSSRVVLFDEELNWNQTILSEDDGGIQLPMRVYYDDGKSQLIVIHGASGGEKIDMFSFN